MKKNRNHLFCLFTLLVGICFFIPLVSLAQTHEPEAKKTEQLEFDGSVIEGLGGDFNGITSVKTKQNSDDLYSKHIDFREKIQNSISEMHAISISTPSLGDQP